MIRSSLLILALLLFLPLTVLATDYYVDFDSGDDTAAGTSTGTAWLNLPGTCTTADSANNSNCAYMPGENWASIVAGDVIYIRSGTTHDSSDGGMIRFRNTYYATNATFGNPITIQRDSSWDSGAVIIDGAGIDCSDAGWGLFDDRIGGIKLDGITTGGIVVQNATCSGFTNYSSGAPLVGPQISNMLFSNSMTDYGGEPNAGGIKIRNAIDATVTNVQLNGSDNSGNGIALGESGDRVIGFIATNVSSYGWSGSDDGGFGFKALNSQAVFNSSVAYNNYKGWDLGEASGTTSWDITYTIINSEAYNNVLGINFNLIGFGGSWSGEVNFYIINTIIRDNTSEGSNIYAGPYNLHIIHSVYEGNDRNARINRDGLSDNNTINVRMYNSVFYKPTGGSQGNVDHVYWEDTGDPMDIFSDYNSWIQNGSERFKRFGQFGGGSDTNDFNYGVNGPGHSSGSWYNFQSWNNDANSYATGGDDTTPPPFNDIGSNDYTLTAAYAGSDISGAGWYITAMGTDRDGTARTNWDVGAYEFESEEAPATHNLGTFSGSGSIQ